MRYTFPYGTCKSKNLLLIRATEVAEQRFAAAGVVDEIFPVPLYDVPKPFSWRYVHKSSVVDWTSIREEANKFRRSVLRMRFLSLWPAECFCPVQPLLRFP